MLYLLEMRRVPICRYSTSTVGNGRREKLKAIVAIHQHHEDEVAHRGGREGADRHRLCEGSGIQRVEGWSLRLTVLRRPILPEMYPFYPTPDAPNR